MAKSSYPPPMPGEKLLLKALLLYVENSPRYIASERTVASLYQLVLHSTPDSMDLRFDAASKDRRLHKACISYSKFRTQTPDKLFANILTGMATSLTGTTLTMGELHCIADSED